MAKVRTTIRMNEDVVKMAKKLGVNISAFTEMKLLEYFKDLENLRRESNQSNNTIYQPVRQSSGRNSTSGTSTDLPGFEPGSEAPEAPVDVSITPVNCNNLDEYIGFRQVEGLSDKWIDYIRRFITNIFEDSLLIISTTLTGKSVRKRH